MDRSRPLWQLVVIDGLRSGQAAYYFKVHHAVVDGQSGVMLAQVLFDITPKARRSVAKAMAAAEHPGRSELAAAALRHDVGQYVKLVRHLPEVVKTLAGLFGTDARGRARQPGPERGLRPEDAAEPADHPGRGFAGASIPLDTLKASGHGP